ncbi:MAG TPA: RidA family protein [Caulobacteraceae bacterium]|jgi:enamine deaminase RidA (YjgF/YER057c/UK114 family)
MALEILLPEGWPRPKGYANGVAGEGRIVFVAGQIGWNEAGVFPDPSFAGQFRQTLLNTLAVLKAGGAGPEDVARMTWFITDKPAYLASLRAIGAIWRELFGQHYPAMAVVVVSALIEDQALVEIETTAIV